ncbi:MAG TPA: hypothetical protein VF896_12055 [Anaerolineales bacterium]
MSKIWRQWIIVIPLAKTPSVIRALESVGKTTTIGVVVFLIDRITTYITLEMLYGRRKERQR